MLTAGRRHAGSIKHPADNRKKQSRKVLFVRPAFLLLWNRHRLGGKLSGANVVDLAGGESGTLATLTMTRGTKISGRPLACAGCQGGPGRLLEIGHRISRSPAL